MFNVSCILHSGSFINVSVFVFFFLSKIARETDFSCTYLENGQEKSCKYLKQRNKCNPGETFPVEVTFKDMKICGVDVVESKSYLKLKGSSLILPEGVGKPVAIKISEMTRKDVNGCAEFEYKQMLDMCKPGLFAELYLEGNDKDTGLFEFGLYKFHEFLRQNCKFNVSAVCAKFGSFSSNKWKYVP